MEEVSISILSQNGINKNTSNHIEAIILKKPDIYIEFTQEDNRSDHDNTILDNDFIKKNCKIINMEQSSRPLTITGGYNIVSKIFKKNDSKITIHDNIENAVIYISTDGSIVGHTPVFSTKAAVCTKLRINGKAMLFVNLHLPMLPGKPGLGVEARTGALNGVISNLITNGMLTNETALIIGGDLNFRIDEDGKDQLSELLKTNLFTPYKSILEDRILGEFSNTQNMFTCKLKNKLNILDNTYIKGIKECRQTAVNGHNEPQGELLTDAQKQVQQQVQQHCGVENRLPSKCDRFLISKTADIVINPNKYQAIYLEDIKSDHNAVYSIFTVSLPQNTIRSPQKAGAKRRKHTKRNYRKRKTIKNKKSNK